jgi:hypothetical protein
MQFSGRRRLAHGTPAVLNAKRERAFCSDVVGGRMGAFLAIGPSTSISAGFNMAYLTNTHSSDFVVPNSNRLLSSVDVGFNTLLWKRTMLSVTTQFGITGHTPDFRVITAIPIRF